jgi:galactokinase
MVNRIHELFRDKFSGQPVICRSPGRINILGEHTDYNEGYVLPAAIDKSIYVAISKRMDSQVCLYSAAFREDFTVSVDNIVPASVQWANYILGIVDQLQKNGFTPGGFNLVIDGDIPVGSGLSSSAAVECAVIFALNTLFEFGLPRMQMALMAQKAEHLFARVNCGIMDQFTSMFGKKGHAIKLDCRNLQYEYIPVEPTGYKIVLFNTNVKHNLASSEYNARRQQCEKGISIIQQDQPAITSLRDVSLEILKDRVENMDPLVYRRCKYIVQENERLLGACEDLKHGRIKELGAKMYQTHQGLRYDYGVSCKELDFLVDLVKTLPGVVGARMMGGGFGGCTINLAQEDGIPEMIAFVSTAYHEKINLELSVYEISIENGTELCPLPTR